MRKIHKAGYIPNEEADARVMFYVAAVMEHTDEKFDILNERYVWMKESVDGMRFDISEVKETTGLLVTHVTFLMSDMVEVKEKLEGIDKKLDNHNVRLTHLEHAGK